MSTEMQDDGLGEFFQRPLEIFTDEWSTTVRFFDEFNPWKLYLENPRVINRISNYRNLKGNLCLKFIINGNGFYYGRCLVSYVPLPDDDDYTIQRGLVPADLVEASQRPHIYLNPTTSTGGTLCLPFLWPKDSLSIPDADWDNLGNITLQELNQLRHANGGTEPISITVFAWMENVSLSVPTAANAGGLTPQAGMAKKPGKKKTRVMSNDVPDKKDEYDTSGLVSKPASIVAQMAGMLQEAPYIGPYMTATQVAASGIANIARIFGYSRPVDVEKVSQYTPRYIPELAVANKPDTSAKLSVDVKQELTIDGRVTGAGPSDEMTIKSISTREAYLFSKDFTTTTTVGTTIASLSVSPCIARGYNAGGDSPTEGHIVPAYFAAMPFRYWRGTMKYRFQIVSSSFHKGRLKIQWDPSGFNSTESNVQYTHIVDISEDKDFTMEIGWGRELGWLDCERTPSSTFSYWSTSDDTPADYNAAQHNGQITVSILNSVTTPSSAGETISLNVFVATDDDFEVAVPNFLTASYRRPPDQTPGGLRPQGGMEEGGMDVGADDNNPVAPPVLATFGNISDHDMDYTVYHGEAIPSFRTLLKRYNGVGSFFTNPPTGYSGSNVIIRHVPPPPGTVTSPTWGEDGTNLNDSTLLAYLMSAFVCQRGGVRWKVVAQPSDIQSDSILYAYLRPLQGSPIGSVNDRTVPDYKSLSGGPTGTAITPVNVNPTIEVEIPWQTNLRFYKSRKVQRTSSQADDRPLDVGVQGHYTADDTTVLQFYCAIAEDFSLNMFLSTPIFY